MNERAFSKHEAPCLAPLYPLEAEAKRLMRRQLLAEQTGHFSGGIRDMTDALL